MEREIAEAADRSGMRDLGENWDAGWLGEMRAESWSGLLTLIVKIKTALDF